MLLGKYYRVNDHFKKEDRESLEKNYRFFQHRDCEFFPCHRGTEEENFNCLFCFCPLYALGDSCGGNFFYTEAGIKSCMNCTFPHQRENYVAVLKHFRELSVLAVRKKKKE